MAAAVYTSEHTPSYGQELIAATPDSAIIGRAMASRFVQAGERVLRHMDPSGHTLAHGHRVAQCAFEIGTDLGWTEARLDRLALMGLSHDLGKVSDEATVAAVNSPDRYDNLSEREQALIRRHPEGSYQFTVVNGRLLGASTELVAEIAFSGLTHHRTALNPDRRYPDYQHTWGLLAGQFGDEKADGLFAHEELREEVRVIALADVVDARTVLRGYRNPNELFTAAEGVSDFVHSHEVPRGVTADMIASYFTRAAFTAEAQGQAHSLDLSSSAISR